MKNITLGLSLLVAGAVSFTSALADAPTGRYTIDAETVRDLETNLLWQRSVPAPSFTHADAIEYCQNLTLVEQSGWRLPTIKELQTLVDERLSVSAIDRTAFPNTPSAYFWSSSPVANYSDYAWVVSFTTGGTADYKMTFNTRVRCVK